MRALGFIWLLPVTLLVWLLYVGPLWALGYTELEAVDRWVARFRLCAPDSYYERVLWRRWRGWSGPCCLLYRPYEVRTPENVAREQQVLRHERRHCDQQFVFGVLAYPLYALASVWVYLFQPDRHPYYDNPFERDARRAAGEQVDGVGDDDRWPWW
jgi:hypothetical protein